MKPLDLLVFFVRGEKVMFDTDLAKLYGVATKALNQAFRRNKQRFPSDFVFQLPTAENDDLRSQIMTSSLHRGRRRRLYAFTEQGVEMNSAGRARDNGRQSPEPSPLPGQSANLNEPIRVCQSFARCVPSAGK
jgi:ORF6N domain